MLRYFQRRVADPELATDLMADTFMTVLELRGQYRGTSAQELSGWLWRIAQSTLREHEERSRAEQEALVRRSREEAFDLLLREERAAPSFHPLGGARVGRQRRWAAVQVDAQPARERALAEAL